MAFIKRITLFLFVNILVVTVISFLLNVLNIQPFLQKNGLNLNALLAFCLVWGMTGSIISLLLSKTMAKWMMGVQLIDETSFSPEEREIVKTVYDLSRKAGLSKMPDVGIYSSNDVNAFATGPSKSNALVALSSGLLQKLNKDERNAVIGHEISHIANGDMVTMTLLQGVINAFVMFLARVLAFMIGRSLKSKDEDRSVASSPFLYHTIVMVLEIAFMILGSLVVAKFSRWREFRADAGGADLAGKEKMIQALQALKSINSPYHAKKSEEAFQAFKISNKSSSWLRFFATHPPLDERIERLRNY